MPKLPDFEDQTQDEFKERQKAQGDIKSLYAYYRLSDHELTVIKLKEKQYNPKTPAYFEGHMNFVFVDSAFKQPFYFGVEGDRLEGDDRGTEENPEPFPPYGNNVIRFEGCTFEAPFEIQAQCMAMFVNCTFTPDVQNVLIKDQSQAEFIGCTLNNIVKAADHSELRFRDCDFKVCGGSYIELENSSTCNVSGGTMATPAISIIKATTDCDALLHGVPSVQANAITMDFSDHSRGRLYDIESLQSIGSIAVYADKNSKVECRNIDTIQSLAEDAIFADDHSEVYCDKVGTIQSLARIAVNLAQGSVFRGREGDVITSVADDAISATDESSVTLLNVTSVLSQPKIAIRGEDSSIRVNQVESIVSQADNAVNISGNGDSQFIDVDNITSQADDALVVGVGHKAMLQRVTHVVSGAGAAVSVSGSAEYIDRTGEDRTGLTDGITAQGSYVTVREVTTIEATTGVACTFTQTGVNLDKITDITGKAGGLLFEDGSGVIREIDTITGDQGAGVDIRGVSAPTEITKVNSITSENDKAFKASGDLAQLRVGEVQEISSPQADSLTIEMDSGSCFFKDIQTITSKQAMAMVVDVQGGIFKAVDVPTVEANTANALDVTVASKAKAEFRDFASITSQVGVAMACDVAGTLQCFDFGAIESQQGKALEVVGSEEADIYFRDVTSPITSQQSEACDVVLNDRAVMAMRSIQGLESTQSVPLNVVVSDSSRFYAVSFLSECTTTQETTWNLTASDDAIIDIRKAQGVSSTDGNALAARASGTASVYLEDVGDLQTTTGGTVIIVASDTGTVTLENNGKVESTDGEALNITASGDSRAILRHMEDVKSTSQAAATINTTGTAKVTFLHLASIESTEGTGMEVNAGAGTELFVDQVPTIKSDQGVAVSGTASGRVVVHHVDSVETSEGQAISLSGAGTPESFVEFKDIGSITGATPSGDLIYMEAGHIRLVNIPTVDGGTLTRYAMQLRSNGPGLGKIEVVDVINITASECRGMVYTRNCGDLQMYCTSQKGTITCPTGITSLVLTVFVNGFISNYSSIENSDGTMNGVYTYVEENFKLENIDSIKGKSAIYSYACLDLEVVNCPSLTAPDSGEPAVYIADSNTVRISGRGSMVIEAKDKDTDALVIRDNHAFTNAYLDEVTISANKGKTLCDHVRADFHRCEFNGSTTLEETFGYILSSKFTCGLEMTDSNLDFDATDIQLGANDGPAKDLVVSNCVLSFAQGEITGSEQVSFENSVIDIQHCFSTPLAGTDDAWTVTNCVFRGDLADWGSDLMVESSSVAKLAKTKFTGKNIEVSGETNVFEAQYLRCQDFTSGSNAVVLIDQGEMTGDVETGALTSVVFNHVDIAGTFKHRNQASMIFSQGRVGGETTIENSSSFIGAEVIFESPVETYGNLGMIVSDCEFAALDSSSGTGFIGAYTKLGGPSGFGAGSGVVGAQIFADDLQVGADSGSLFAKCEIDQLNINLRSGVVSADGVGDWSGPHQELGLIFARHNTALAYPGTKVGLIGASMPEDIEVTGTLTGVVISQSSALVTGPEGLVGASLTTVEDTTDAVIANAVEETATVNLVGVGVDAVNGAHTNVAIVGCNGEGFTTTTGGLIVGGTPASAGGAASYVGIGATLTGAMGSGTSVGTVSVGGSMSTISASQGVCSVGTAQTAGVTIAKGGALLGGNMGGSCDIAANGSNSGGLIVGITTSLITNRGGLVTAGCTGHIANHTSMVQVGSACTLPYSSGGYGTASNTVSVGKLGSGRCFLTMEAGNTSSLWPIQQTTGGVMNNNQYVMWNNYNAGDPEFQIPAGPHAVLTLGQSSGNGRGILEGTEYAQLKAPDVYLTASNLVQIDAYNDITIQAERGAYSSTGATHASVATGGSSPTHTP